LRQTSISLLLKAGEHIKVVCERAGHKDVETTLRFYCHVLPTMQQSAADQMEKLLG
jgi:site-specific recombinase XerD